MVSQGSTLAVFRYPEHPRFSDGIPDSPEQYSGRITNFCLQFGDVILGATIIILGVILPHMYQWYHVYNEILAERETLKV